MFIFPNSIFILDISDKITFESNRAKKQKHSAKITNYEQLQYFFLYF